jgi:hypothetical protein
VVHTIPIVEVTNKLCFPTSMKQKHSDVTCIRRGKIIGSNYLSYKKFCIM